MPYSTTDVKISLLKLGAPITTATLEGTNKVQIEYRREDNQRDPLRKTLKDSSGWRSPLPYFRRVHVHDVMSGVFLRRYNVNGSYDRISQVAPFYSVHDLAPLQLYQPNFYDYQVFKPDFGTLKKKAEAKALKKLLDQEVNLSVFMAESGKAVKMIGDNAKTIQEALTALSKKDYVRLCKVLGVSKPAKWRSTASDLSGRWLEVSYGWLPLLSDLHSMLNELAKRSSGYRPRVSVCTESRQKEKGQHKDRISASLGVTNQWNAKAIVKVRLDYELSNPWLHLLNQLGLVNPATVAWELVPYSFVVDWFLSIGDWLQGWTADIALTFRGGTYTQAVWFDQEFVFDRQYYGIGYGVFGYATAPYTYFQMTRSLYNNPPKPSITFDTFGDSVTRSLNLIALLGQKLGK